MQDSSAVIGFAPPGPERETTIGVVPQGGQSLMEVAAIIADVFGPSSQMGAGFSAD
jgi:hypothetical protein